MSVELHSENGLTQNAREIDTKETQAFTYSMLGNTSFNRQISRDSK